MLKETVKFIRKNQPNMAEVHNALHEHEGHILLKSPTVKYILAPD